MRKTLIAVAALGLLAASPAYAVIGSGTVDFQFNRFTGPYAATFPQNLNDPSQWLLTGEVNGQTPTPTGHNVQANGIVSIGGTEALSGNSVDMVYTNLPGALDSVITFTPHDFTNVQDHTPFLLGTLSYTNGQWVGGSGNAATNFPVRLDFTIQTHSSVAAFNQTIHDSFTVVTNSFTDFDCATNPVTQQNEADFIYITGTPQLGSVRVYDLACKPPTATNVGAVDLWMEFGSLDYVNFRNPTGSAFIIPSVDVGPIGGGAPEPAEWALLMAGFGVAGAALRRRSARRAIPVHA